MKKKFNINNIIYWLIWIACVAFIGWVIISFFNVIANNSSPDTTAAIWDYNFFKLIFCTFS